ncbi:MAG: alpha/beta fold hydrolase [Acetobacteraceae bacterium]
MRLHVSQAGSGPTVVLLHGLFGMGRNLGFVQRALAQRFHVLALDLRNHGASPHGADMCYDTMAEDVVETLQERDVAPAAVIGHSMGGKTAMRLALRHPDAVGRLCVADIAPVGYPPRNGPVVAALRAVSLTPGLTRAQADAALAAGIEDASLRAFLLQNLTFGATPSWRIGLDEIAAALPDLEGWPDTSGLAYDGPTLFVAGARSDFIRPDHRDPIRALFPHARFVTVKNAGHWLHVDNPSGFLGVVEAFLAAWQG